MAVTDSPDPVGERPHRGAAVLSDELPDKFANWTSRRPNLARIEVSPLVEAHRLVVKIGSALLVDPGTGLMRRPWLETLVEDVVRCHARGQDVVIVTSGAVAIGLARCADLRGSLRLEAKQAAAAIGQGQLMLAYEQCFKRVGLRVGQVLLTSDDTERQRRRLNARATLDELLRISVVPIINENDTTAIAEIRFGDNDRLAARVAQMVGADVLVLLSDVDGLYTADPRQDPSATLVPEVYALTPEIEAMAGHAPTGHSSGGMVTKLLAAKIAMDAGCRMVIAAGNRPHPISAIENGSRSTWFMPSVAGRANRQIEIVGSSAR